MKLLLKLVEEHVNTQILTRVHLMKKDSFYFCQNIAGQINGLLVKNWQKYTCCVWCVDILLQDFSQLAKVMPFK